MMRIQLNKSLLGSEGRFELAVDLELKTGTFLGIHGPSGAGKTSLLRMIAGLMIPDSGLLEVDGVFWQDASGKVIPPQKRNIGFLFQDYALFPHLSVLGNLEFAANSPSEKSRIPDLLKTMELEKLKDSMPNMLSGGQQQRVALARALVRKPRVLLLDEPLSALDTSTRLRLQDYLAKVHREFETTTIMVSHDASELHRLADRIVELKTGRIAADHSVTGVDKNRLQNPTPALVKGRILEIETDENFATVLLDFGGTKNKISIPLQQAKNLEKGNFLELRPANDSL